MLFCDNGSEFTSQAMDLWAYRNGVRIDFCRPGKPTDNAFVESFNGTFRAECLDVHWFRTIAEAKQLIEGWRREYNESRPHRALSLLEEVQTWTPAGCRERWRANYSWHTPERHRMSADCHRVVFSGLR